MREYVNGFGALQELYLTGCDIVESTNPVVAVLIA